MRNFLYAIKDFLMLRSAPFETPPAAAPQDKGARLEARTMLMQYSRPLVEFVEQRLRFL